MPNLLNKKILVISIVALSFILAGSAFYFLSPKQPKIISPKAEESEQKKIINQQLIEIDELKQRTNARPLTEKEKQAQIKELGTLYKQSGAKPLSQAEIQKQLEELNKLRLAK